MCHSLARTFIRAKGLHPNFPTAFHFAVFVGRLPRLAVKFLRHAIGFSEDLVEGYRRL